MSPADQGETVSRSAAWIVADPAGMEFATLRLGPDRLSASGVAIGTDPLPYRLDYTFETAEGFLASRLTITARGDRWDRTLDLRRDARDAWTATLAVSGSPPLPPPGGDLDSLAGARDIDLGRSPLFNTIPVLRHQLMDGGGPVDLVLAWVSVPALGVHRSEQRYAFVRRGAGGQAIVRFEGSGPWGDEFSADLTFDPDGLVADYPALARRVHPIGEMPS